MPASRPLLRPAVLLERSVLGTRSPAGFAVTRTAALAVSAWKRLGYVCVALGCEMDTANDFARVRAEATLQRDIAAGLRGFGGMLDGTYVVPRPGEEVDADVPRASVFARLVLEAATKHRIDLPRSLLVASSLPAVGGARIAGIPCALVARSDPHADHDAAARLGARPDFVVPDLAAAAVVVEEQRARQA